MNKAQLVEALAERLGGDKKTAAAAVESTVDIILRAVSKGEKVQVTGFGVFEKRERGARTARNPATGEKVKVKKTSVPAFRAGQGFKDVVSGARKLPKAAAASANGTRTAATRATARVSAAAGAAKAAGTKATGTKATTTRTTRTASAPAKTAAKATTATKTAAKKAPAKAAVTRKAPAKAAPATKKAPAKKAAARK